MEQSSFKIFGEQDIHDFNQNRLAQIRSEIEGQKDDYILNVSETEFINFLVEQYSIKEIEIDWDKRFASVKDAFICRKVDPDWGQGQEIKLRRPCITYHIPIRGSGDFLVLRPGSGLLTPV